MLRKPTPGILLFGPTGSGKSLIADVIANENDAHCIQLSGRQLASFELQHHLPDTFEKARRNTPALIILDKHDLIFKKATKW